MRFVKILLVMILLFATVNAQKKQSTVTLKTLEDSISYSIGHNIGVNLKEPYMKINFDMLAQGMKDAISNSKILLTEEQMQNVMMIFNQRVMEKRDAEAQAQSTKAKEKGKQFLDENAKKEGVVVLPSGLQYKVLVKGDGPSPKPEDKVSVHYTGTLIDGTKFDSSYDRNAPAVFGVTQVIKGWTEALQLMHVGDKWQLFIPSDLAYGETGAGGVIGPGEVLIFEVELLSIIK
ncbi:MAG: FKBP-type peptidyl-prolyl cis-trans isomerase [Ignavibacteria bacterium]|nr:FKBP-type peptidyl-prolyl cis-trans isomerase [Ignavibacteria bacterium]